MTFPLFLFVAPQRVTVSYTQAAGLVASKAADFTLRNGA
jgi:hypothetical protein